jgi:hypothetical protein
VSALLQLLASGDGEGLQRGGLGLQLRVLVVLGEAAVLTGALAVGLQAALENAFLKRTAVPA